MSIVCKLVLSLLRRVVHVSECVLLHKFMFNKSAAKKKALECAAEFRHLGDTTFDDPLKVEKISPCLLFTFFILR